MEAQLIPEPFFFQHQLGPILLYLWGHPVSCAYSRVSFHVLPCFTTLGWFIFLSYRKSSTFFDIKSSKVYQSRFLLNSQFIITKNRAEAWITHQARELLMQTSSEPRVKQLLWNKINSHKCGYCDNKNWCSRRWYVKNDHILFCKEWVSEAFLSDDGLLNM